MRKPAGDDAYDLLLDTDEVLDNPLLGPLVRGALRVAAPSLDPAEVKPFNRIRVLHMCSFR